MIARKSAWMDEDLQIFSDSVRKFFEREALPHNERWNQEGKIDRDFWNKAGDAGLLCVTIPEEYGGMGGDFRHEAVIVQQEQWMHFSGWGNGVHSGICAPYILSYGTEEQKKRWLPKLATGEMVAAIAMTEPGTGSDLQAVRTTARRDGDSLVINGQKTFITNGQHADLIIVVCKTGDVTGGAKNISLVVVEANEVTGYRRGRNLEKVGLHAQDTSELFFDDVRVPAGNILGGDEGRGFYQLMQQLPRERLIIALGSVAGMEAAIDVTVDYVKQRKAFGKALLDFQNTQFVLANCKAEAVVARTFVDQYIERLVRGELTPEEGAVAKLWACETHCRVVDKCLQLFGGYGYMMEYPIGRMYADARIQRIYGGTSEIMRLLISRAL